jgi:hypothetical protein
MEYRDVWPLSLPVVMVQVQRCSSDKEVSPILWAVFTKKKKKKQFLSRPMIKEMSEISR